MNNLKPDRDGDYEFLSGDTGKVIEVAVRYSKGGANFLSGSSSARGVYLHVTPIEISEHCRSYTFSGKMTESGTRILLRELNRKSKKHMDAIAADVDTRVREICDRWEAGDITGSLDVLRSLKAKWYCTAAEAAAA